MSYFPDIAAPDPDAAAAARDRQTALTKPAGALGRLEDLSVWVAACQGACPPKQFERARVVVFAGDHGVAAAGVSAYPSEVTAAMVANFDAGGAAVNVLAERGGRRRASGRHRRRHRRAAVAGDRCPQDPPIQRQHRRRGRADARRGGRGDRGGPPDRRRGGRRRRRPADRRRHGHRQHHACDHADRRADRHRTGRGGRPRHRHRRRRLGPQDRRDSRRALPHAHASRPTRSRCCGSAVAPIWPR